MPGNDINLPNLVSHLQVNLQDTSGLVAEAGRQGSSVGAALGQSLQQRVAAAVRDIPEVQLTDNSSQLDRDLERVRRELAELSNQRIGVDVDVTRALRSLDDLQPHLERLSREHPDVQVQADIARAATNLAEIEAAARHVDEQRPEVDVRATNARPTVQALEDVEQAASRIPGALSAIGGALGPLASIAGRAGAAIPAVAGLVATLEQIGPAAAVGATAAAAVGSALGAVKLGTSGIGDALSAAFAPATGGGGGGGAKAAAAATNALADAQRDLKDAIEQAAYANQQATRQVASAQRDLGDALKAARQAQLDLIAAQKQAARQLEDQNNQLIDAKNDERQAVLDVEDAQKNLDAVNAAGSKASQEDRDKAQLQYDRAVQALEEQRLTVQRLQTDTDAANKAGVSGSQLVQDAQAKVADTARDVSDRQQAVADAQTNVQRTAAQGAEAIDKAREALQQAAQAATGGSGGGAAGGIDKFAAAMAKLSPAAQAFVREVIKLKPAFDQLRLDVQQRLFSGLAGVLDSTAHTLLPAVRRSLDESATSLNSMAVGVAAAARGLATTGVLGQALDGANRGLSNLTSIPPLIVDALGKLAAAAAPSFDRLTEAAARAAATLSGRLDKAFASGALTKAIDEAVDALGRLLHVGGNVVTIIGNILAPANATGGGLIGILTTITDTLAKGTGSKGFQNALSALFEVMNRVGRAAGPLLLTALADLEPIFTDLQGPADDLIDALSAGLQPILTALRPLLDTAARAVGALVEAALPLIPVASELITSLGPDLQPILDDLVRLFRDDLAPAVATVADAMEMTLGPILATLPATIGPLADLIARNLSVALLALARIVQQNSPEIQQLTIDLGELLIAAGPLIDVFTRLTTKALVLLTPLLLQILDALTRFTTYLVGTFTGAVNDIVLPALRALSDLLHGRVGPAFDELSTHASGAALTVLKIMAGLPGAVFATIAPLVSRIATRATEAANALTRPISSGVGDAVEWIGDLPGRAAHALGDLSGVLFKAGKALIQGFVDGIQYQFKNVKDTLGDLTSSLTSWKGPPDLDARLLTPAGQSLIQGFMRGIDRQVPALRAQLQSLTAEIGGMPALAGAVPSAGVLAASYAGSRAPAQGPVTINQYGTEATPQGVADALSWLGKVGRH